MNPKQNRLMKELPALLLPWYRANARDLPWRKTKEPYAVWLSEIMLQQTRVEAVKDYYMRFMETYPTIQDLADADESALLKLWEGLGYYSRARNLHKTAKIISQEYGGVFPERYPDILALPGIGEYTAGAISSICFRMPTPAVDGNVLRVMSRFLEMEETLASSSFKKEATSSLANIYPRDNPGDFTQALMELGATVCIPNGMPMCDACPIAHLCLAKKHKTQDRFPRKTPKKPRKQEEHTVFLLLCGEHIAIKKRPDRGLLREMWEFPNTPGLLDKTQAVQFLKDNGMHPKDIQLSVMRNHIFTHVEWTMQGYLFTCHSMADCFTWVTKEQLEKDFALPTAFRQFMDLFPG